MADRNKKIFGSVITNLLLVGIFAAGWTILDSLEDNYSQTQKERNLNELRQLIPLMRERLNPISLARENLLSLFGKIKTLDSSTAPSIAENLRRRFGDKVCYALWKADGEPLATKGFAEKDIMAANYYFETKMYMRVLKDEESLPTRMSKLMTKYPNRYQPNADFPFWHQFCSGDNYVSVYTQTMNNRDGLIMMGLVYDKHPIPCNSLPMMGSQSAGISEESENNFEYLGRVMIFIPQEVYTSQKWMERAIKSHSTGLDYGMWIGRPDELNTNDLLPPALVERIALLSAVKFEGADIDGNIGACFVRFPLRECRIVLHARKFSPQFRLSRSPITFLAGALLFGSFLFGFRVKEREGKEWDTSLIGKFFILSLAACLIPTLGMVWFHFSQSMWESNAKEASIFKEMEEKLEKLESQHELAISNNFSKLKKFVDDDIWRNIFDQWKILPLSSRDYFFDKQVVLRANRFLSRESFQGLYYLPYQGPARHYNFNNSSLSTSTTAKASDKKAISIISKILDMFRGPLKIGESSSDDGFKQVSGIPNQAGLIYEVVKSAIGDESVAQIVMKQDEVFPFQIFSEIAWSYSHPVLARKKFGVSPDRRFPIMFFFVIWDRAMVQRQILTTNIFKNEINKTSLFRIGCLSRNVKHENLAVFPRWFETQPHLQHIFRRLSKEGGLVSLPIKLDGKVHYCHARRLRGMEYVVMAVRSAETAVDEERNIFLTNGIIIYPFLITLLMIGLFRQTFLNPLLAMKKGVDGVVDGNFDIALPVLTDDEIGDLCQSFNRMAASLKEKEFLRRFLSDLTMEAVSGDQSEKATRLRASVMFVDIRSFTTLSEEKSPEEIVEMLNSYLTMMEEIVESNGGTIDKFIGDAIMADFLPAHGMAKTSERAVKAGLDMMKALDEFNKVRRQSGKFTIKIGVGIATGEVLMGVLGRADGRKDFTVTGSTVNRAAYMEKRTKSAQITHVVVCPESAKELTSFCKLSSMSSDNGEIDCHEIVSLI